MYKKIAPIIILCFTISSCLPIVLTGAAISITEFSKDRTLDQSIIDLRIASNIKAFFMRESLRRLYTRIGVKVVQGRVFFTGLVYHKKDIKKAIQIAWNQKGVVEVIDKTELIGNNNKFFNSAIQYTKDSIITAQIKSKAFIDKSIKSVNYTIITINNIVYLFGIARSEEELKHVAILASSNGGVKKVISHVNIKKNISIYTNH